jgi:FAD dependent oxidoreductase
MSLGNKTAVTNILKAAHYGGPLEIYHIGPFARRISFATQQTRALNLIWALKSAGKIDESSSVVVIGGGLAGITAAASLAEMKCRVTLLEKEEEVLSQQAGTSHRVVHPNINHWPEKDAHPTTQFPLFDWFAGKCSSVITNIRTAWTEKYVKTGRVRFVGGVAVERHVAEAGGRISFRMTPAKDNDNYSAAIVAAGFAKERVLSNYPCESYWVHDGLEAERNSSRSFVVSGCGDGGLLDALRLAFKTEAFDRGKLTIKIVEMLGYDSETSKIIRQAEKDVEKMEEAEASIRLEIEYRRAVAALPDDVGKLLLDSLYPKKGVVTLVGREPKPYSLAAAPINKLLLTIAKDQGRIAYDHGTWAIDEKKTGKFTGTEFKDLPGAFKTIIRLGAPLTIQEKVGLVSENTLKELKENQFAIWEMVDSPHWQGTSNPDLGHPGHPFYDPTSDDFIRERTLIARRFVATKRPGATVAPGTKRFELYLDFAEAGPELPRTAFGILMEPTQIKEVPSV